MQTVHCTLYTTHGIRQTAHCTLKIAHHTLYITYCTPHIAHWTLHYTHCTLHTVKYALSITHSTLQTMNITLNIAQPRDTGPSLCTILNTSGLVWSGGQSLGPIQGKSADISLLEILHTRNITRLNNFPHFCALFSSFGALLVKIWCTFL